VAAGGIAGSELAGWVQPAGLEGGNGVLKAGRECGTKGTNSPLNVWI
jgi:hypothetical protein